MDSQSVRIQGVSAEKGLRLESCDLLHKITVTLKRSKTDSWVSELEFSYANMTKSQIKKKKNNVFKVSKTGKLL